MSILDDVRLLMWTHGSARPDLGVPGLLVLLALGWGIEAIDHRYCSFLVSHNPSSSSSSSASASASREIS
jgi:hypothetical protein